MTSLQILFNQAVDQYKNGRMVEAEVLFLNLLQQAPQNPLVLYNLGIISLHLGKDEAGIDFLGKAAAADPLNRQIQHTLYMIPTAKSLHATAHPRVAIDRMRPTSVTREFHALQHASITSSAVAYTL